MFDFITPTFLAGLTTGAALGTITAGLVIYKRAESKTSNGTSHSAHTWRGYLLFGVTAFIAGVVFEMARVNGSATQAWTYLVTIAAAAFGGWFFNSVIGVKNGAVLMNRQRQRHLREMAILRQENVRLRRLLDDDNGQQ